MVHWLVRNAQIFQTASMPLDLLWDRIRLLASLWCSANGCLCVCVCVLLGEGEWLLIYEGTGLPLLTSFLEGILGGFL